MDRNLRYVLILLAILGIFALACGSSNKSVQESRSYEHAPMQGGQFMDFRSDLANTSDREVRFEMIASMSEDTYLLTDQIRSLLSLFETREDQLQVVHLTRHSVADPNNTYAVVTFFPPEDRPAAQEIYRAAEQERVASARRIEEEERARREAERDRSRRQAEQDRAAQDAQREQEPPRQAEEESRGRRFLDRAASVADGVGSALDTVEGVRSGEAMQGGGGSSQSCCVNGRFYDCPSVAAVRKCTPPGLFSCLMNCSGSSCEDQCMADHPIDPSDCNREPSRDQEC